MAEQLQKSRSDIGAIGSAITEETQTLINEQIKLGSLSAEEADSIRRLADPTSQKEQLQAAKRGFEVLRWGLLSGILTAADVNRIQSEKDLIKRRVLAEQEIEAGTIILEALNAGLLNREADGLALLEVVLQDSAEKRTATAKALVIGTIIEKVKSLSTANKDIAQINNELDVAKRYNLAMAAYKVMRIVDRANEDLSIPSDDIRLIKRVESLTERLKLAEQADAAATLLSEIERNTNMSNMLRAQIRIMPVPQRLELLNLLKGLSDRANSNFSKDREAQDNGAILPPPN